MVGFQVQLAQAHLMEELLRLEGKNMISFSLSGSTEKTSSFLARMQSADLYSSISSLAQRGVTALQSATPVESGATAAAWSYEIQTSSTGITISWINTNSVNGVNIAVILQFGHGTGTGGYVSGRDYINPAIKPVMDEIANEVWRKVTSL